MRAHNSFVQPTRRSRHRRIPVLMGGRFLPSNIAGLQLWLDANDASTLFQDAAGTTPAGNGDVVGAWADKSGQGNDATQTTTARKPTIAGAAINGLNAVRGDSDDFMEFVGITLTNETIIAVIERRVNNTFGAAVGISANANFRLLYSSGVNNLRYQYNAGLITATTDFVEIDPHILRAIYNGTNLTLTMNNGTTVSAARASASHVYNRLFVDTGNELDGDIAEFLIWNRELLAAEIIQVENYLSNKWEITLS